MSVPSETASFSHLKAAVRGSCVEGTAMFDISCWPAGLLDPGGRLALALRPEAGERQELSGGRVQGPEKGTHQGASYWAPPTGRCLQARGPASG